ncbi:hypothetical protein B9Z55_006897 [Caenorhabditis nigoni]|uniref:Uncharacterized protein n=2 Tax=Caenorhabditis nigoni TaxID=1611254 RepID=A0A2G5V7F7_9PELO|nr:hypothetical protein B9Z55_006897 [Caenorhabditis nigoni]
MVVIILNSSNTTYWIPAYSLNDTVYHSYLFYLFAFVQISIYIFTGYLTVRTCFIFFRIKVFHENMNILMAWFLCQWFEAILAKLVVTPYQIGLIPIVVDPEKVYYDWWADDKEDLVPIRENAKILPLLISSYFIWHYLYSILFSVLAIGLERVAATYYIQDYENVRRRHIPVLLIIATNCISIPYAFETLNYQVTLLLTCIQSFLNGAIIFVGYIVLWRVNIVWRDRISSLKWSHNEKYSLARKFQIEENIKSLRLARKLVISAVIFISVVIVLLICLGFELTHGYDTFFVYALDNAIFLPALVMCVTLLCCSPSWKEKFLNGIPRFRRRFPNSKISHLQVQETKPSAVKETEVYFEQLKNAWT